MGIPPLSLVELLMCYDRDFDRTVRIRKLLLMVNNASEESLVRGNGGKMYSNVLDCREVSSTFYSRINVA